MGMGKEFYENFVEAREVYDQADEILGFKVSDLCFNGPADKLKETVITQPAIYTTSMACHRVLIKQGVVAGSAAGHSIGEYAALTAAGSLDLDTGLRLVKKRGEFIQKAAEANPGTMAAIIGLSEDKVKEACERASSAGVVEPANFNSPGQIVISGERAEVEKAMEYAREAGAKRTVLLEVSGAFHSSIMRPAREDMVKELAAAHVNDAVISVVANVTADYVGDRQKIRELLGEQIDSPALWNTSMETLVVDGFDTMIEVGPGKVLSGLIRRISKDVKTLNVEDIKSMENTLEALGSRGGN